MQARGIHDISYINKKNGKRLSFWDIWKSAKIDFVFQSLQPNGEKIKHGIHLSPDPEFFAIAVIGRQGFADVESFNVIAEFWIEEKWVPFTAYRRYEGEEGLISDTVECETVLNGEHKILAIHRKPLNGGMTGFSVSIRLPESK
jgi:hypothetical protein